MSKRKANNPWLVLGPPGTRIGNKAMAKMIRKPNRRRAQELRRRINVTEKILAGKMKPPGGQER